MGRRGAIVVVVVVGLATSYLVSLIGSMIWVLSGRALFTERAVAGTAVAIVLVSAALAGWCAGLVGRRVPAGEPRTVTVAATASVAGYAVVAALFLAGAGAWWAGALGATGGTLVAFGGAVLGGPRAAKV